MAKIERFEDLEAWRYARSYASLIYHATQTGSGDKDFGPRDQMRKASVLIMTNIAVGFEKGDAKEFIQYLHLARDAAVELRSLLYAALDFGCLDENTFTVLSDATATVSGQILGLINRKTAPPKRRA